MKIRVWLYFFYLCLKIKSFYALICSVVVDFRAYSR